MDKTVLFYWSKGAKTRLLILNEVHKCNRQKKPCFLTAIAKAIGLSHVGAKKHVDLLVAEAYLSEINPQGKPVYLQLTENGKKVLGEFKHPRPKPKP